MTRADLHTALANAIMARSLIRRGFPAGRDRFALIDALDGVINTLDKYQPEDAS